MLGLNTNLSKKISTLTDTPFTASSITIPAGSTAEVTVTCTAPTGYSGNPIFGYVRSTGWAGIVPQGISIVGNQITATLYNATTVSRTVTPIIVAIYVSYS